MLAVGALLAAACTPEPEAAAPQATASIPTTTTEVEASPAEVSDPTYQEYPVPRGTHPHDVAPAPDGRVWYTAQRSGGLGVLDPATGNTRRIPLGATSAPHGVIVGPDGAPWITDGGLNAIVRVDPDTFEISRFPLPRPARANLNTGAFDGAGNLWFTGQAGIYGSVAPSTGRVRVFDAPRGTGPYGIAATPEGVVWYSSLAGSYIARIAPDGRVTVTDVPTPGGGARRVWSDSRGRLWVTEWFAGRLAVFDPSSGSWKEWSLPGAGPRPYAVFVDDLDVVWVTDFSANALLRFNESSERFRAFPFPSPGAEVRQLLGRPGEVWGAESGTDKLVVLRTSGSPEQ